MTKSIEELKRLDQEYEDRKAEEKRQRREKHAQRYAEGEPITAARLAAKEEEARVLTQRSLEMRKTLQMFLSTLDAGNPEVRTMMLQVPSMFPKYQPGKEYKENDIFSYGVNSVGDPQLYCVKQNHTSAPSEERMLTEASDPPYLYEAIGVTKEGYPEWSMPLGTPDAYNHGDIVSYNGTLYLSTANGNVEMPDASSKKWVEYTDKQEVN